MPPPSRLTRTARFFDLASRGAAVGLGLVFLLAAWRLRQVLLLTLGGALVGVALRRPACRLARWTGMRVHFAVLIVVAAAIGILALTFWLRGADIARETEELTKRLPQAAAEVEEQLRQTSWGRNLVEMAPEPSELMDGPGALVRATKVLTVTVGGVLQIVLVLFLGVIFAMGSDTYVDNLIRLIRPGRRARWEQVIDAMGSTLAWWLVGRAISMAIIGTATAVGLWLLGIPLALPLALIAALLTFIPNLGPIIAAVPAVLLAFPVGLDAVWKVIALYVAIQVIETYLIEPIVEHKTIRLPPGLTIPAQVAMGLLAGIPGVALATPLVAVIVVFVRMIYVEDGIEA